LDADDDDDGVSSYDERGRNSDGDALEDRLDPDDDNDGLTTVRERKDATRWGEDVDRDQLPNYRDADSDGDAVPDRDEVSDIDADGVPDYLERGSFAGGAGSGCSVAPGAAPSFNFWIALAFWALRSRQRRGRR
jgi:hypothetical protein